jgi:hypothetical protein
VSKKFTGKIAVSQEGRPASAWLPRSASFKKESITFSKSRHDEPPTLRLIKRRRIRWRSWSIWQSHTIPKRGLPGSAPALKRHVWESRGVSCIQLWRRLHEPELANAVRVGFDFPFHGSMPRMVWRPRGSLSQGGARHLHSNQHNCCHQKRTQFL